MLSEQALAAIEARLDRPYPMDGTDLVREVRRLRVALEEVRRLRVALEEVRRLRAALRRYTDLVDMHAVDYTSTYGSITFADAMNDFLHEARAALAGA